MEYLYEFERYRLTAIYARHLLWWAVTYSVNGVMGFHAIDVPEKSCTILVRTPLYHFKTIKENLDSNCSTIWASLSVKWETCCARLVLLRQPS